MDEQERLRASQDLDLSDIGEKLRVQHGLIQSLAKTQSEHTATLAQHTATLDRHTATLAQHTATLDRHTATLDRHTAMHKEHASALGVLALNVRGLKDGMQQIIGMLDTLISRENPN